MQVLIDNINYELDPTTRTASVCSFGTLQKIFDEFTFTDGTPCGKEVVV